MKDVANKINEWYAKYINGIQEDDCFQWICLKNRRGQIYSCAVFKGICIDFYKINLDRTFPVTSYESDTLLIAYCIDGRVEGEFRDGSMSYLPEHHLGVTNDFFQCESISFPLNKYEGISIKIDLEELDDETKLLFDYFKINIQMINNNLNQGWRRFVCRSSGKIETIIQELQEKEITLSFLRLKVIELLQVLQEMDYIDEKASSYYPKQVIAMTKEICREMIRETDNQVTIEQIVEKYDISIVVFYKVFMQVYGDTPYSYLKKYKMNIAAVKLSEEREKIGDIALELGYSNPSKFSKAFKSVYGVLPKDYRKKHFTQGGKDDKRMRRE